MIVFHVTQGGGSDLKLDSITITTPPSNSLYGAGQTFDPTGMVVTGSYNDGTLTGQVTGYTVTPAGALAAGTTSVTITYSEGGVTKTATQNIVVVPLELANATPEQVKQAAQSGQAQNLWDVGDKIGISINGTFGDLTCNDTVYAFVLGFNHNSAFEGGNSIHFQFGKNSSNLNITFIGPNTRMTKTTSGTNSGGWRSSYMRGTVCTAFLGALPTAWQSVIVSCTKYTDNTGGTSDTASYVTATSDRIWLPAEYEILGSRNYANSSERNYQAQYAYYANGNSVVMYNYSDTSSKRVWFQRSPSKVSSYGFCAINSYNASEQTLGSNNSEGFSPCFMVA